MDIDLDSLVTADTRVIVAGLVDTTIEREYQAPDAEDRVNGATILAVAALKFDLGPTFRRMNGEFATDRGLEQLARTQLRILVKAGLDARLCQCMEMGAPRHGHSGRCTGHTEADVPPVNGKRLCGTCYCVTTQITD